MPIIFNSVPILSGSKQYINGNEIKDIVFNGVNIWHYDNTPPSISIFTPKNASYISSTSNVAVTGVVSDADSGIANVMIGSTYATLSNIGRDANGRITSCSFSASITSNDFNVTIRDNAGNKTIKHVTLTAEKYNDISRGSSNPAPGDQTYTEWCRCNICGRQGSAHKWRNTGNNVYDEPDTLFSDCPNGPHYRYKVSIT